MESLNNPLEIVGHLRENLPYLRRYARALKGSQESGDALAAVVVQGIGKGAFKINGSEAVPLQLFRALHQVIRQSDENPAGLDAVGFERRAQRHLSELDQPAREALLLSSLEGFTFEEIAAIRGGTSDQAEADISRAQSTIARALAGKVLIIEDESVIALELKALVHDLGHEVIGVAPSYDVAIELGRTAQPDLILADIKLAGGKTGIEAVQTLVKKLGVVPTIFVTAYPELFLSGKRPEPAFLIAKPFTEDQIRTAVGQAMFFASTEVLVE